MFLSWLPNEQNSNFLLQLVEKSYKIKKYAFYSQTKPYTFWYPIYSSYIFIVLTIDTLPHKHGNIIYIYTDSLGTYCVQKEGTRSI